MKIAIVSNSKNDRLIRFCETYHLDNIMRAHKPRPRGLQQCMARFGFAQGQSAIVGDQIFWIHWPETWRGHPHFGKGH